MLSVHDRTIKRYAETTILTPEETMRTAQKKLVAARDEIARTNKLVSAAAAESCLVRQLLAWAEGREREAQAAYFVALKASAIAEAEVDLPP